MKLHHRKPDIENLYKVLRRETPQRHTLFELFMNQPLYERLADRPMPQGDDTQHLAFLVEAFTAAGYDYTSTHACAMRFDSPIPAAGHSTVSMNEGARITDWESFEAYNWPNPDAFDYSRMENIAPYLPEGMKLMLMGPCGVLENVTALVGFENLCFMLFEEPELAEAIFEAVGSRMLRYYEIAAGFDSVGLLLSNDDWGFNTQTFFSPDVMRRYVFPWHRRIVEVARRRGIPAILHSCGNLDAVMGDIVDMGFAGKHSYEDNILPVEDAYDKWHGDIAILGGMDVNFMANSCEEEIQARCRNMLQHAPSGYALGSGNSIPEYLPQESYFAMISTALEMG